MFQILRYAVLTFRQVAAAPARRLHDLAHGLARRPPCCCFSVVEWDLDFVLQHIRIILVLIEHPQADSGPDWFPTISPIIAHAFDSVHMILENVTMQAANRNPPVEICVYAHILKRMENMSHHPLITSPLVRTLLDTFVRLIVPDSPSDLHSGNQDLQECKAIIARLELKFPQTSTSSAQPVGQTSLTGTQRFSRPHQVYILGVTSVSRH